MKTNDTPIWYVPGPFYRYEQDVKALARKAGLRVVDAHAETAPAANTAPMAECPQLSLKDGYDLTENDRAALERVYGEQLVAMRRERYDEQLAELATAPAPEVDAATAEALRQAEALTATTSTKKK